MFSCPDVVDFAAADDRAFAARRHARLTAI
jgi:hypothetical protein